MVEYAFVVVTFFVIARTATECWMPEVAVFIVPASTLSHPVSAFFWVFVSAMLPEPAVQIYIPQAYIWR
jgi:hypothetical protein